MRRGIRVADPPNIRRQHVQQRWSFALAYGALLVLFFVIVRVMDIFLPAFGTAILILAVVLGLAALRPAALFGLAIPLALVGDAVAMPWWPTVKNLSNRGSILYTADGLTVTPFELLLALVVAVWLIGRLFSPSRPALEYGPLFRPLAIFTATLFGGFVWGMARGGDLRAAVFELGPMLYIPAVYFISINLFTTLSHYRRLAAGIAVALTIEVVHGLTRLPQLRTVLAEGQSPIEHTAALHLNLLFLMLVSIIWFRTARPEVGWILAFVAIPTLVLYLEAERRAAVIGLVIGGLFLAAVLFKRDNAKFVRVIPAMLVVIGLYSGAFWGSESQLGFPAQAVRGIVEPGASSEKDSSSDLYREIENFDLNATIRANPITGIGFGQQFYQPIPLPDISFFEFWRFIPHNSILWLWTKVGIVGFLAFLYFMGQAIIHGVGAAIQAQSADNATLIAVATSFIPMTMVVAFVDITFDGQTTILLGLTLALATSASRLEGDERISAPKSAGSLTIADPERTRELAT